MNADVRLKRTKRSELEGPDIGKCHIKGSATWDDVPSGEAAILQEYILSFSVKRRRANKDHQSQEPVLSALEWLVLEL